MADTVTEVVLEVSLASEESEHATKDNAEIARRKIQRNRKLNMPELRTIIGI